MKRILTFFKMDMALSFRDSLMVYSLVSPIILAVIFRIFLPTVQEVSLTFAVDSSIDMTIIEQLETYGSVEKFAGIEQLRERVNRYDDVPGIYQEDGTLKIILEGNEDEEAGAGISAILQNATDTAEGVTFEIDDLKGAPPPIREYAAVMMIMLSLFVGGILVGFNIVDEKETNAVRALAVSPLRMFEYIGARSILALIIGLSTGFAAVLIILGLNINYGLIAVSMLVSLLVALPFGFIIGAFADNQMKAFALIKLLMAVFLTLPFVSIFVPPVWQWPFFILPNYWMFLALSNAVMTDINVGFGFSVMLTAGTGCGLIALLIPRIRKRLKLR